MPIKFDMSKAYDWVEWVHLENVMRKMGFNERWIKLIMACVKTVSYSILVNGKPQGFIQPTRGICQGDPLSPFLFLLCTEGLHGLIQHAANMGEINVFPLCRRGPALTHLLFVDDSLLFCRATSDECKKIIDILEKYEGESSQKMNKNKIANSLANLLWKQPSKKSWLPWVYKKLCILSNNLDCHYWWVEERKKASILSKKRCGENYKGRKGNSYLKPIARCSLK